MCLSFSFPLSPPSLSPSPTSPPRGSIPLFPLFRALFTLIQVTVSTILFNEIIVLIRSSWEAEAAAEGRGWPRSGESRKLLQQPRKRQEHRPRQQQRPRLRSSSKPSCPCSCRRSLLSPRRLRGRLPRPWTSMASAGEGGESCCCRRCSSSRQRRRRRRGAGPGQRRSPRRRRQRPPPRQQTEQQRPAQERRAQTCSREGPRPRRPRPAAASPASAGGARGPCRRQARRAQARAPEQGRREHPRGVEALRGLPPEQARDDLGDGGIREFRCEATLDLFPGEEERRGRTRRRRRCCKSSSSARLLLLFPSSFSQQGLLQPRDARPGREQRLIGEDLVRDRPKAPRVRGEARRDDGAGVVFGVELPVSGRRHCRDDFRGRVPFFWLVFVKVEGGARERRKRE